MLQFENVWKRFQISCCQICIEWFQTSCQISLIIFAWKMGKNGQKWILSILQNILWCKTSNSYKILSTLGATSIMTLFARCSLKVLNWLKILREISNTCKSKLSFTFDDRIFYVAKWAKIGKIRPKMSKNEQKWTKPENDHF